MNNERRGIVGPEMLPHSTYNYGQFVLLGIYTRAKPHQDREESNARVICACSRLNKKDQFCYKLISQFKKKTTGGIGLQLQLHRLIGKETKM
jgi:hypothetical protein